MIGNFKLKKTAEADKPVPAKEEAGVAKNIPNEHTAKPRIVLSDSDFGKY